MSKKKHKQNRNLLRQNLPGQSTARKQKLPGADVKGFQFWMPALLLLFIIFLTFLPSLSLAFVNWDDAENLLDNDNLKIFAYEWNWKAVKTIFSDDVIGNYNPLPIFTFAIEKYFFAKNPATSPFVFHFNNLWMHMTCTFFVFVLLLKLGLTRTGAFIGALLFGIHPMRVESVAWVTERKDVLYGMFFMAALIAYVNFIQKEKNKTKWYVFSMALSLFSYFAKVQAVVLPLSMVAIDFYLKRKWSSPKILILEKLPWWVMSIVFGVLNIYFLKQNKSIDPDSSALAYTFIDRLAVGAYAYVTYLAKWIFPYFMSPLYPYPKTLPSGAYISLVLVPVTIVAFLIWAFKKKKTTLIFGWAFFTFNIMFLLQILAAGQGFLADRFTYIAYFGLFFLTAKGYEWVTTNKPDVKTFIYAGLGLYFVLFIFLTIRQIKIWQNGGTLWEYVKKHFPNNVSPWNNGAYYYREEEKNFNKAIEYYKRAIALEPNRATLYNSLAKTYFDQCLSLPEQTPNFNAERKRLAELAITSYSEAERMDSLSGKKDVKTTSEIVVNKGVAYAVIGDFKTSLVELTRGIAINPKNTNGYLNRSLLYLTTNRYDLAWKDYDEYIKLDTLNADVFYERAVCKNVLGKFAEALPDLNKAISLKNTQPLFFIERAKSYKALGNNIASKNDVMQAQKMGAKVPPELLQ
ncbi:MAG TPA: hypothetical protein VFN30_11020 [Chitinophagaceae bacterium]|nr:hypothetical protein [Chitinophagaceae bacterium]